MAKRTNNKTNKFRLDRTALDASMVRYELAGTDGDDVQPLEPDLQGTDADRIHDLITQAIWSGSVITPGNREIMIYPSSVEEPHVCVITVWDAGPDGKSHVVAGFGEVHKLASRELWTGEHRAALTEAVVEQIVAIANGSADEMDAVEAVVRKRAAGRA